MKRKMLFHISIGAFLFAAVFAAVFLLTRSVVDVRAQVQLVPFQAERMSIDTEHNSVSYHETFAFDSHGTTVTIGEHSGHTSFRRVERMDGFIAEIVDSQALKSTGYQDEQSAARVRGRSDRARAGCLDGNGVFLRKERIQNVETSVIVRNSPAVRITQWMAPELGCYTLRLTQERKQGNSFLPVSRIDTVNIKLEEPDPKLFLVPDDYAEVSLAELERHNVAMQNPTLATSPAVQERLRQLESEYGKWRSQKPLPPK
jgi:hypothetical protein